MQPDCAWPADPGSHAAHACMYVRLNDKLKGLLHGGRWADAKVLLRDVQENDSAIVGAVAVQRSSHGGHIVV